MKGILDCDVQTCLSGRHHVPLSFYFPYQESKAMRGDVVQVSERRMGFAVFEVDRILLTITTYEDSSIS